MAEQGGMREALLSIAQSLEKIAKMGEIVEKVGSQQFEAMKKVMGLFDPYMDQLKRGFDEALQENDQGPDSPASGHEEQCRTCSDSCEQPQTQAE
jgi:hypothetical protein